MFSARHHGACRKGLSAWQENCHIGSENGGVYLAVERFGEVHLTGQPSAVVRDQHKPKMFAAWKLTIRVNAIHVSNF
jgi:hypothetical protein